MECPPEAKDAALRFAAELFHAYAVNHLGKAREGPSRLEKAHRNADAASKMYAALCEPYEAPRLSGDPSVPVLPVAVAEVTGNIEERELAARYIDGKVQGVVNWINNNPASANRHDYEVMQRVLAEIAYEFRIGLHLPAVVVEGRVIPYNEDRGTGISHADALRTFFTDVHERNVRAGWWTDIETGQPKKRNVGEMFMLMVTEIWEAYQAYVAGAPDDKLTHHPGLGVEIGDLAIRMADFCGALIAGRVIDFDPLKSNPGAGFFEEVGVIAEKYESIRKTPAAVGDTEDADFLPASDPAGMIDEKLAYNSTRKDHKIENRLAEGGKRT